MIFHVFRYYRPFAFFSGLATLFLLSGVAVGIPPILEFLRDRFIHKVPSAILATGLCLSALLCYSIGIILQSIRRSEKVQLQISLNRRASSK